MKSLASGLCRILSLAALLGSCNSVPPMAAPASAPASYLGDYRNVADQASAQIFEIDPVASQLRIYAFRGGRAAFAGHDHVLTSHDFAGFAYLPAHLADARFDLEFPLDRLGIDDPALRAETGGAFAGTLDSKDIAATREHMLDPDHFDAAHFPLLQVHGATVAGELPKLVVTARISLHGVTRTAVIPVDVRIGEGSLAVSGAWAFRQSDFGVKPYSILGGLLAVQDEVAVEFRLVGHGWLAGKP